MTHLAQQNPWLVRLRPAPQVPLRLFCFPYAGGGASLYRTWATDLHPHVEVCAIQFPGRENRLGEPPFRETGPLVAALKEALLPSLQEPFAFFGYSMGAVIAFELARALRTNGIAPTHLFVAASPPPRIPYLDPEVTTLSDEAFVAKLRSLKGTPEAVLQNPDLMQLLLPTLRADFELCARYQYTETEPLDTPIIALGGLGDVGAGREELEGWRQETRSRFSLHMFPGDHFFLHSARVPIQQVVLQRLVGP